MLPRALIAAALAALLAPAVASASCAAHPELRDGRYVNIDPGSRSITALDLRFVCGSVVRNRGGGVGTVQHGADPHWQLRLWGSCSPRDCDWGQTRGVENARRSSISARYEQGFARRSVIVAPDGDHVIVVVRSTFTDGRAARQWIERFRRL